jgi:hypothetical protein
MAHTTLQVAPDASGPLVDFQILDTAAVRQTMTVSDATVSAADARVLNADAGLTDFALVVRPIVKGNTVFFLQAAATNNATVIKASTGKVFHIRIYNTTSTVLYTKFYNKTTTPLPASDSIFFTLPCQAGTWTHLDSFNGQEFTNGIGVATVTGISPTNNTAVAADSLLIVAEWK